MFLAIIIVPAFALWGSGSLIRDKMSASHAGEIFSRKIPIKEFRDAFSAVRTQALIRFGDNFYQVKPLLNLEERAWERLILLQKTREKKIKVNEEDIVKTIAAYPFFQKEGKFDNEIYNQILRYGLRVRPRDFERHIQESLKIEKLLEGKNRKVTVSEAELLREFKKENEKVKTAYISFNSKDFLAQVSVTEEEISEIKNYYQKHKQDFRTKPQIDIEYLALEIEEDGEEKKTQLKKQMLLLLEEAKSSKDLDSLTKERGVKIIKTGLFNIDEPIPEIGWSIEFLNAIANLKPGQISGLIETTQGYYIIKLVDLVEPYLLDLQGAKEKVLMAIKKNKASEEAAKKAYEIKEQLEAELKKGTEKEFKQLAKALNLQTAETPFFKRGEYLDKIGISDAFSEKSFSLADNPEGKLAVANTPLASYIIKLLEFETIDEGKFKEEKEEYRKKLIAQKKQEVSIQFLEELKQEAHLKNNLSQPKKILPQ